MSPLKIFTTSILFFMVTSAFAQIEDSFKMPDTWIKGFTITLSYHSSMSGSKTNVTFTFDSCTYQTESRTKRPKLRKYKMKENDRVAILKKLQELKVDKVKSESSIHAVHDGWSQSICFETHCIEGGTSAEMSEADKNIFLDAYRYLEEFASKKAR